jgi:regulator of sigma E protease
MATLHTLFYFIISIGTLVAIHEFGHFWVARKVGVKVLRFSIGFGKALWRYQKTPDSTEYVIAAFPLGGYVKMVDEREGTVAEQDLPFAFNRQSVLARVAIVAAGPVFNLLLAVALYWSVFMIGETGIRPIIGKVEQGTLAFAAGFTEKEEIIAVNGKVTPTWLAAMEMLFSSAPDGEEGINVSVRDSAAFEKTHLLKIPNEATQKPELLYQRLGLTPWMPVVKPIVDKILPNSAATSAGLKAKDLIVSADGIAIKDWTQWVDYVQKRPEVNIKILVNRSGTLLQLNVKPQRVTTKQNKVVGKIGAGVYVPEELINSLKVRYSLPVTDALVAAVKTTWHYSTTSLFMMGKMLVGNAPVENLSGPISIAQYAGQSAEMGLVHFLKFMAIVSISLGVLNLLPIPVLDGGHLLFFAIEAIKGSPVSEKTQIVFQNIGVAMLMTLMILAVFLDLGRLFE